MDAWPFNFTKPKAVACGPGVPRRPRLRALSRCEAFGRGENGDRHARNRPVSTSTSPASSCVRGARLLGVRTLPVRSQSVLAALVLAAGAVIPVGADPGLPSAAPNQPVELPPQSTTANQEDEHPAVHSATPDELKSTGSAEPGNVLIDAVGEAGQVGEVPSAEEGGPATDAGRFAAAEPSRTTHLRRTQRVSAASEAENSARDLSVPWYRSQLGALGLVLAAIAGCFWALRRWAPALRSSSAGAMRVVARAPVGPRQVIAVLQLGRRFMVIGVSPGRVDSLCTVDDPREAAELAAVLGVEWPATSSRFTSALESQAADFDEMEDDSSTPVAARGRLGTIPGKPGAVAELLERLQRLQRSA